MSEGEKRYSSVHADLRPYKDVMKTEGEGVIFVREKGEDKERNKEKREKKKGRPEKLQRHS